MTRCTEDRLVPLLALAQAASLIDHVAATGTVDRDALDHLLACLLREEDDPAGLGNAAQYRIGRRTLLDLLAGELPENQARIPDYMRAMMRQERRLARHPALRDELARRLARAREMRDHFAREPAPVQAAVAGAYADTVGELQSRVRVVGALRQLMDRRNGDIIRTALLGGVQAAGIWRARGGRWRHLRWRRRELLKLLQAG